ncbi:uncharacterized protein TNCV_2813401 [Trichonephila clavipes]|nr:uncharacterized protein TNCV_2813401 [Trichonephila clavipes]
MGLLQADAARRLNVSRSVVQRLWDQYQSEDFVSRRPWADHELQHLEDRFLALSARRRRTTTVPQLIAIRKKNSSSQFCMQNDQLCSPQRTTAKEPLMLGKRTCFGRSNNGASDRRVQIYNGE